MFLYNAKAIIKGGKNYPEINGTVYFKETKNGVIVTAKINGLPKSKDKCTGRFFGFHIHDRRILHSEIPETNLLMPNHIIILPTALILIILVIYHLYLKTMVMLI